MYVSRESILHIENENVDTDRESSKHDANIETYDPNRGRAVLVERCCSELVWYHGRCDSIGSV
ncbi:hypothetical protein D3C80_1874770 [compost metagenome]